MWLTFTWKESVIYESPIPPALSTFQSRAPPIPKVAKAIDRIYKTTSITQKGICRRVRHHILKRCEQLAK